MNAGTVVALIGLVAAVLGMVAMLALSSLDEDEAPNWPPALVGGGLVAAMLGILGDWLIDGAKWPQPLAVGTPFVALAALVAFGWAVHRRYR